MAVGDTGLLAGLSYLAIGRETTLGTYNTCTASMEVLSSTLKTMKESKILEQVEANRARSKFIQLGKVIEGELEFYFYPGQASANYILQHAFGGSITSATATGETAGGAAFTHEYKVGNFNLTYTSLCLNNRKGDVTNGKVFQYSGVRVNELNITGELDEPLMMSSSLVIMKSTVTSNDVATALTQTTEYPLDFAAGRISVETSFASLTSTSFWHVQSFELGIANNFKTDNNARRIGSDELTTIPLGKLDLTFNATIRFNTTTAYDAMLAGTQLSAELEYLGPTLSTSIIRRGIKIQMPKLIVSDAGDPEVSGPDGILTSQVQFLVLRDETSATGYAIRALVTNATANYN